MRNNYFTKVEDKFVFNLSTIFWHFLILIFSLALIAGLFMLVYGIIPASKLQVPDAVIPPKPPYPAAAVVTLDEILSSSKKTEQVEQQNEVPTQNEQPQTPVSLNDPNYKRYQYSLDKLEILIPPSTYNWKPGHYEYPYGEAKYKFYHDENDRVFVKEGKGLLDLLEESYNSANAHDYGEKKKLLDSYNFLLDTIQEDKRLEVLHSILNYPSIDVISSVTKIKQLKKVLPVFQSSEIQNASYALVWFGKAFPGDAPILFDYLGSKLMIFNTNQRLQALYTITNTYSNYFRNAVSTQIDATNLYMGYLKKIDTAEQASTLARYYNVFNQKNLDIQRQVQAININYEDTLNRIASEHRDKLNFADNEYSMAKAKKSESRFKGAEGIFGAIALIAFTGVILTLLSMQRILRKMQQRMESANKPSDS